MLRHTFQPGVYFIGDPCYAIEENSWGRYTENIDFDDGDQWIFIFDGHLCMVGNTAYGDGVYDGLSVDSGLIGITPIELVNQKEGGRNHEELGKVITYTEPFEVTIDDGTFWFGDFLVETKTEEDFYDDEENWFDVELKNEAPYGMEDELLKDMEEYYYKQRAEEAKNIGGI